MAKLIPGGRPAWPVAHLILQAGLTADFVVAMFGTQAVRLAIARAYDPGKHDPWAPRIAHHLLSGFDVDESSDVAQARRRLLGFLLEAPERKERP